MSNVSFEGMLREGFKKGEPIVKDVSLFRLLLTPMELYVLKYFVNELRPLNVREIYSSCIVSIFCFVFGSEESNELNKSLNKYLLPLLINSGYGSCQVDYRTKQKVMKEVHTKNESQSETEVIREYLRQLVQHKSKVPSYDKIKKIVEDFEKKGIVTRRNRKEEGTILYTLNPQFYESIKSKREDLIRL